MRVHIIVCGEEDDLWFEHAFLSQLDWVRAEIDGCLWEMANWIPKPRIAFLSVHP